MKSKSIILKKDNSAIASKCDDCSRSLEQMQSFINWFNSLSYITPITDTAQAKEFLSSTKSYHDQEVVKFLQSKQDVLPPNLQPLRDSWNISNCDEVNFSKDNRWFDFLELKDGTLQYNQQVYTNIEAECTIVATPEQAAALKELDRTFSNLERISEALYEPGIFRRQWLAEATDALSFLRHHRPGHVDDPSLLTPWKVEAIDKLAAGGFGQSKK